MSSRWLLLDIGNTHTVAGLCDAGAGISATPADPLSFPGGRVRFRTDPHTTSDEYRTHLSQLFGDSSLWSDLERVIVSTVVPALENVVRAAARGTHCLFINSDTRREFELELPYPNQLGADRLANVAGALGSFRTPLLIVDAGTATTFCVINERPAYVGGAIVPGLETGWKALQARAARLFSVELVRPESSLGRTTETQLQSGVLLGYEALIEGMTDRLLRDAGPGFERATCIATGGCVSLLRLSKRFRIEPDLTLAGLVKYGHLTR